MLQRRAHAHAATTHAVEAIRCSGEPTHGTQARICGAGNRQTSFAWRPSFRRNVPSRACGRSVALRSDRRMIPSAVPAAIGATLRAPGGGVRSHSARQSGAPQRAPPLLSVRSWRNPRMAGGSVRSASCLAQIRAWIAGELWRERRRTAAGQVHGSVRSPRQRQPAAFQDDIALRCVDATGSWIRSINASGRRPPQHCRQRSRRRRRRAGAVASLKWVAAGRLRAPRDHDVTGKRRLHDGVVATPKSGRCPPARVRIDEIARGSAPKYRCSALGGIGVARSEVACLPDRE